MTKTKTEEKPAETTPASTIETQPEPQPKQTQPYYQQPAQPGLYRPPLPTQQGPPRELNMGKLKKIAMIGGVAIGFFFIFIVGVNHVTTGKNHRGTLTLIVPIAEIKPQTGLCPVD